MELSAPRQELPVEVSLPSTTSLSNKEAPLKASSCQTLLNFTRTQSEFEVYFITFSFFQSISGGGGLYHPLSPTFLCSLAQVMVKSLLQMELVSLGREKGVAPHLEV